MQLKIKERIFGPWPLGPVLWFHGASLGECRVLNFLAKRLIQELPICKKILITSQKPEVVSFLKESNEKNEKISFALAPLPINSVAENFYKKTKPIALVLCENELWPAYLKAEKKREKKGKVALVSGRFSQGNLLPKRFLSPEIFGFADFQTHQDKTRFLKKCELKESEVTGNWKLFGKQLFKTTENKIYDVAFLSLHQKELSNLIELFKSLSLSNKTFLVAPRREYEIAGFKNFFKKQKIKILIYPKFEKGAVTIVESFGKFREFLPCTKKAVVGGSFVKRPGIHDFYEPLLYGVETYIGPFAKGQNEMVFDYLQKGILTRLPLKPKTLPITQATSLEIIKFIQEELDAVERSYSDLRNKLIHWISENEKIDFSKP